jgi:hypothetical protein
MVWQTWLRWDPDKAFQMNVTAIFYGWTNVSQGGNVIFYLSIYVLFYE